MSSVVVEIFSARSVHAAAAAQNIDHVRAACEWVCGWIGPKTGNPMQFQLVSEVCEALCCVLKDAQDTVSSFGKRQITLYDVDVITTLAPFYKAILLVGRSPTRKCIESVSGVVVAAIETDAERTALAALVQWCKLHECRDFLIKTRGTFDLVMSHRGLVLTIIGRAVDVCRLSDGSVQILNSYSDCPGRSYLLVWKPILKKLLYWLEEDCMSDAECAALALRLPVFMSDLNSIRNIAGILPEDITQIAHLLRCTWLAASCKWGPLRAAWIAAVIRGGVIRIFPC